MNQFTQSEKYYKTIYPAVALEGTKVITSHSADYLHKNLHSSGSGMISPDGKRFWLTIPKNASDSTCYQLIYMNKWKDANCFEDNLQEQLEEIVITLRDPIDRWKKCVLEITNIQLSRLRYVKIQDTLDEWIAKGEYLDPFKYYDGHFFRQVDRIAGVDQSKVKYVCMGDGFPENLESVLGYGELPKRRIASENEDKTMIWEKLEPMFTDEVVENAKTFYALDIELYDRMVRIV